MTTTDAGREFLTALDQRLRDGQDDLLAALTPAERAELVRLLRAALARHSG